MPVLSFKSKFFAALEASMKLPEVVIGNRDLLVTLTDGEAAADPRLLQLSSNLIRFSQVVSNEDGAPVTFEFRLSGIGITPVSSLRALERAIENGLAGGTLTKLEVLQGTDTLLTLTADAQGYHATWENISLNLLGRVPLTFTQIGEIAGLLDRVDNIDMLSAGQRQALFSDLDAFSLNGFSAVADGKVLFAVNVTATEASLTVNGITATAQGSFPDALGETTEVLWSALSGRDVTPRAGFDGLEITTVTIEDAGGKVVGRINDPLGDTPTSYRVDGKAFDHLLVGSTDRDTLIAQNGTGSYVLSGLANSDRLIGGAQGDILLGGGGRDQLVGNGGRDNLAGGSGDDRLNGGAGRDVLTGGKGVDTFVFGLGDGSGVITDFEVRTDVIQILDAERRSDLTFTVEGDDLRITYRDIQIVVEDVTLAQINQAANFDF